MNCQDFNQLLDTSVSGEFTRTQRESIDQHLSSCTDCSEDWANVREMAALLVPATPVTLRRRIAAAVQAQAKTPVRRVFRPFLVGSLLLIGAAVATAVALKFASSHTDSAPEVAAVIPEGQAPGVVERVAGPPTPAESEVPAIVPAMIAAEIPLDPHAIVVLQRPEAVADGRAVAVAARCHDAMVRQLRTIEGLRVIANEAVFPYERNGQARLSPGASRFKLLPADQEIGRKVGAGNVLIVTTENGCAVTQFNTETGLMVTGIMAGAAPDDDYLNSLAGLFAQNVRDKTMRDQAAAAADDRSTVLNVAVSEEKRVAALMRLGRDNCKGLNTVRCVLDKEVVAAASLIGSKSANADVRSSAWVALRGVDDASLVQPLLEALANDPDAKVRMQAAFTLNTFLDRPGVREALLRAAAQDPSRDVAAVCCTLSVREAAQRASIADKDFKAWVLSTLLDPNLPVRSRLMNLQGGTPDSRFMTLSIADFGAEAAAAVFDIGRYETNPGLRRMAWTALQRAAPNDAYVTVLLGDLTGNPDEYVRGSAAQVLARYTSHSDVRTALERARTDPSMYVRGIATAAVGSAGN